MLTLSKVYSDILNSYLENKYTIISLTGGTRSGKSFSIMQFLYTLCISPNNKDLLISVCSRSVPHLRRGVMRDFDNILASVDNVGLVNINKTSNIYEFINGNKIEFWSLDDVGKIHGSQRDIIYINECNYIEKQKIQQLFARTSKLKIVDYNPSNEFWIEEYRERKDFIEFHSTYLDNDFLSEEQIKEIESNKNDPYWWSVYGLGKGYIREGLVYPNVVFDTESHEWKNPIYAIDWGFNDPCVCVKLEIEDNILYVQEMFYKRNMDITDIKKELSKFITKNDIIIADNAAPAIIHEMNNSGFHVKACKKGKDSILDGIRLANQFEIHCLNSRISSLGKEFCSYSYEQDISGMFIDKPEDKNNHGMDALRYGVVYLRGKKSGHYSYSFI